MIARETASMQLFLTYLRHLKKGHWPMADGEAIVTAYEQDIAEVPAALLRFAETELPPSLVAIDFSAFERIILTGMGGSDCATIPLELALAQASRPVWRLLAGRLLETPEMVTESSLLIVTSQSGRSGEVVALLNQLQRRPRAVIGITADAASPVAMSADIVLLLQSGAEATVATKSYANTLAAIHRIACLVRGEADAAAVKAIRAAARSLTAHVAGGIPAVDQLAARVLSGPKTRLALIGSGPDATTAIAGAMVLKEAAKVAAEGYVGGSFRHGPLELAGPGLTALFFGTGSPQNESFNLLTRDLVATGSTVVTIAPSAYAGSEHIAVPGKTEIERLLHGMYVVQRLSVGLARASGIIAGAFNYGRKVTDQL
jgi:glutamine---fructose-6-phosphate transaminase (isomerizing)